MGYIPAQGDLVWLNFTPQSGHEQSGKRPALVISNDYFNRITGLALICPITSKQRAYPLHVNIGPGGKIYGSIMVEQIKSVDYQSRGVELIEKVSPEIFSEVLARLHACL